jgi:hypothetical protein
MLDGWMAKVNQMEMLDHAPDVCQPDGGATAAAEHCRFPDFAQKPCVGKSEAKEGWPASRSGFSPVLD